MLVERQWGFFHEKIRYFLVILFSCNIRMYEANIFRENRFKIILIQIINWPGLKRTKNSRVLKKKKSDYKMWASLMRKLKLTDSVSDTLGYVTCFLLQQRGHSTPCLLNIILNYFDYLLFTLITGFRNLHLFSDLQPEVRYVKNWNKRNYYTLIYSYYSL